MAIASDVAIAESANPGLNLDRFGAMRALTSLFSSVERPFLESALVLLDDSFDFLSVALGMAVTLDLVGSTR